MKSRINFRIAFLTIVCFNVVPITVVKSQKKQSVRKPSVSKNVVQKSVADDVFPNDVVVLDKEVPVLIPQKQGGKFGYVNQSGKFVIQPDYHIALFFGEDCNLIYSPNEKVKKFGAKHYATVDKGGISYRINMSGKIVYTYKPADLGVCKSPYIKAKYRAYKLNGKYGVIDEARFVNPSDKNQYTIYPTYDYLFVMESDDPLNPMIIVAKDNSFGIVNIKNQVVIPLQYKDIKRNYSWKLGHMFEVTDGDANYFYVDVHNKAYRSAKY